MWETLLFRLLVISDLILLVQDNCPGLSDVSGYVPNSGFYCCHGEVRRMTRMRKGSLKGCCRAFFPSPWIGFSSFMTLVGKSWGGPVERREEVNERNLFDTRKHIQVTPYSEHPTPAYVHAHPHWVPLVGTTCIPIKHSHRNSRRCALLYHWSLNTEK